MLTLTGTIQSLKTFPTGFTLGELAYRDPDGVTCQANIVGTLPHLAVGEAVELDGDWTNHPRYGRQFKVTAMRPAPLTGADALLKYLSSGLLAGVGPSTAAKIVAAFGERTLDVFNTTPERLADVRGIGPKKAATILASWQAHQAAHTTLFWLQSHGCSPRLAAKIYKAYGLETIATVSADPYSLEGDIPGVGFLTADRIARALGVPFDAPARIAASMSYVLELAANEGHAYLPFALLVERAASLLGVPQNLADDMLRLRLHEGHGLVSDRVKTESGKLELVVYLGYLHRAEVNLAAGLRHLAAGPTDRLWQFPHANWAELRATFTAGAIPLTEQQADAVQATFTGRLTVLTGGPGTGKTVTLAAICRLAQAAGVSVALAAPTGRAAQRMTEVIGLPAKTVHRLLEVKPQDGLLSFARDASSPLDADLVIVDEASMLDLQLTDHLVRAIPAGAHLLLVGDIDQLPSVGAGNVLHDVIAAIEQGSGGRDQGAGIRGQTDSCPLTPDTCAVVRLGTIFRQAAGSYIITNAHRVNRGERPLLNSADSTDFFLFRCAEPEPAAELVRELVATRIPAKFGLRPADIQVLSPMHRGTTGTTALNASLQGILNPLQGEDELRAGERVFRPGDRVMQTANDYTRGVMNGDLGYVLGVNPQTKQLSVDFDGAVVTYENGDLDSLVHAWCITIHKAQGSEFPAAVIPLLMSDYVMLQRNLLYTAITRARRLVVLVGSDAALAQAVRNDKVTLRYSGLLDRLDGV